MSKAAIIFLLGATLYITISKYYAAGNTGAPPPQLIGPAVYLFGILTLAADFLSGVPVAIAAGLTVILWERANSQVSTAAGTTTSGPSLGKTSTSKG